jgi:hypothetical protein
MEQPTLSRLSNKPIPLSALGRQVKIGDLYNYNTDLILPSKHIFPFVLILISVQQFQNELISSFQMWLGHFNESIIKPSFAKAIVIM